MFCFMWFSFSVIPLIKPTPQNSTIRWVASKVLLSGWYCDFNVDGWSFFEDVTDSVSFLFWNTESILSEFSSPHYSIHSYFNTRVVMGFSDFPLVFRRFWLRSASFLFASSTLLYSVLTDRFHFLLSGLQWHAVSVELTLHKRFDFPSLFQS